MSEKIRDRAILSRFSDALSRGEVQIYLQAQVAADSRRVIGAEALSRWVCDDGRVIHDMYLFEVKKPAESKAPWDYYKTVSTIPAQIAFKPLESSSCPLVKK